MVDAWNAAIAFVNLSDLAASTITASSELVLTPAQDRLRNVHVARKWRANVTSATITIDLGSSIAIDTIALMGCNLTAAGFTQGRISTTDPTGTAGEVYDSTLAAGRVDPAYGYLIFLLPTPVNSRYIRIDFGDTALSYIEAGRLFVGVRTQFPINFVPGWSRGWVDRSKKTESRGGQMYMDINNSYRTLDMQFDLIDVTTRWDLVEEIDRLNGEHSDFLMITDPTSTTLGRDSIWGFIEGNQPVSQSSNVTPPLYSKTYRIRERL